MHATQYKWSRTTSSLASALLSLSKTNHGCLVQRCPKQSFKSNVCFCNFEWNILACMMFKTILNWRMRYIPIKHTIFMVWTIRKPHFLFLQGNRFRLRLLTSGSRPSSNQIWHQNMPRVLWGMTRFSELEIMLAKVKHTVFYIGCGWMSTRKVLS